MANFDIDDLTEIAEREAIIREGPFYSGPEASVWDRTISPELLLSVLRELKNAYRSGGEAQIARDKWADLYVSMRAERDALAAKVAALTNGDTR